MTTLVRYSAVDAQSRQAIQVAGPRRGDRGRESASVIRQPGQVSIGPRTAASASSSAASARAGSEPAGVDAGAVDAVEQVEARRRTRDDDGQRLVEQRRQRRP